MIVYIASGSIVGLVVISTLAATGVVAAVLQHRRSARERRHQHLLWRLGLRDRPED